MGTTSLRFSKLIRGSWCAAACCLLGVSAAFCPAAPLASPQPNDTEPPRISVTQFGALRDGRTLNTRSIQAAIDKLAADGGGTLVVPEGVFLSGAIFLKPTVNLHLDKGATLKGSTDINDYPKANTRIEGHSEPWRAALVNADGVEHLRLTGEGTLDGSGAPYWAAFWKRRKENPKCTNLEVERPRLLFLRDCRDLQVTGLHLKDSGFWNLHLYRCRDARVERLDIRVPQGTGQRPPSTDGIDLDSCQDVTVTDCTIAVNDDCIALKGTKGPFALEDKDSPPDEHIRIAGCTFEAGHAALTCGSEATIVRDVVMEHCTVTGKMPLLHLKLRPDTPQEYHDVHVRDVVMRAGSLIEMAPWSQFFDLKGQPPPKSTVADVSVSGVTGSLDSLGVIRGNPDTTLRDITLKDCDLKVKSEKFDHGEIEGLRIENVKTNGAPFPAM